MQVVTALDVLIIDDDPLLRSGLRSLLEWEGFRCAEAGDGRKALDVARRWPPQCVFVDLALPGLDGFAVARRLRSDPRTRRAHVHCLTGRGDAAARRRARRAGCEAFLTKPVEAEALLGVLRRQVTGPNSQWVYGLNGAGVQELADWLENNGCQPVEASFQGEGGFAVRCVCPPGLVLGLEAGRLRLFPA
jgi:CheY-like chemotaxis protein